MTVHLLLEGQLEEIVARKLLAHCGYEAGIVYGKKGCQYVKDKTHLFHKRAELGEYVLVLTDFMDSGCSCLPEALHHYLTRRVETVSPRFLLRFAVREIESWLLADRVGLAKYLGVPLARFPQNPEAEASPKQTLVNIARSGRNKKLREAIVPTPDHGGSAGPGYVTTLQTFIELKWNIDEAQKFSQSLRRCIERLRGLAPPHSPKRPKSLPPKSKT